MQPLNKILYVEDDPDVLLIAEMALGKIAGYELCLCSSGELALEQAESFAPDFILLDVMMPGMGGIETLKNLRKLPATSETPTAFLTAKALKKEVDELLALGAVAVIAKPFDPLKLAIQVDDIWKTHCS